MRSFAFVLCFGFLSLGFASYSKHYNGFITKVKISKEDIELRREEISDKLIREYETIELGAEESVNVLYNDSLIVHGRSYTFDVSAAINDECPYGPILPEDHHTVYYHVRDLKPDENTEYLNYVNNTDETASPFSGRIGGQSDDIIVPTITTDEHGDIIKDTDKFALVRPIRSVKYHCEEGSFCCGNRCCPQALKTFLQKIGNGDRNYEMIVPIDNEQTRLYVSPRSLNGSDSIRNCGYVIESDNYFGIDDPTVDAVRYTCPKNNDTYYICCADNLCCPTAAKGSKPASSTGLAVLKPILIAIFVICGLLFVASLWYCCHYKRHARPPPHTYIAPERQTSRMSRQSRASRASESSKC